MKKIISILLLTLLAATCFAFGCDCKGCKEEPTPENPNKESVISFDYYSYTLDLLEEFTLVAHTKIAQDQIVWASSNEGVATVNAGKVKPVAVGETAITATVEGGSAVCYVSVVDGQMLPLLSLQSGNKLDLFEGDTFPVGASLTYNKKDCENVTYTFTTENAAVATVSEQGVITAISKGTTRIKVVASWNGVAEEFTTEYITVNVVGGVTFKFNKNEVELYAMASFGGEAFQNTQPLTGELFDKDGNKINQPISYRVENENICTFDGSVITAQRAGATKIVATATVDGEEHFYNVEVTVKSSVVENDSKFYLGQFNTDLGYIFGGTTKVDKLIVEKNGVSKDIPVENNAAEGVMALESGAAKVTVTNEKNGYVYTNAEIISLCVSSPNDFMKMRTLESGTIKLVNDIDMAGTPLNGQVATLFKGELDGQGYVVSNIEVPSSSAIFSELQGTVKNIVINNIKSNSAQFGTICWKLNGGTIDNAYVTVSFHNGNNHSGGVARQVEAKGGKVINSVIVATIPDTLKTSVGVLFSFGSDVDVDLTGSYIIKSDANAPLVGRRDANEEGYKPFITTMNNKDSAVSYDVNGFVTKFLKDQVSVNKTMFRKLPVIVEISTADELLAMRNNNAKGKYFILTQDIDFAGFSVAAGEQSFNSIFDGQGHTISNLTYASDGSLFRSIYGTVKNLTVKDAKASGQAGGLCVSLYGTVDNVNISVNLASASHGGGITKDVGNGFKLTNSIAYVTSTMGANCGLLIGFGSATTYDLTGTYAIKTATDAALVGARGESYATFRDAVNGADNGAGKKSYTFTEFEDALAANIVTVTDKDAVKKILYYEISTAEEFLAMRNDSAAGKYYKLTKDIDFVAEGYSTVPIATASFAAILDGCGYTIKNITYAGNGSLFATIKGTVKNLNVKNVKAPSGSQGGGLCVSIEGTIDNVNISVDLSLANTTGGFAKTVVDGFKLTNSIAYVTSTMGANCGLLIGFGSATTYDLTGTYAIKTATDAALVGARGESYATFRDAVNGLNTTDTPRSFTCAEFDAAIANNTLTFSDIEEIKGVIYNDISSVTDFIAMQSKGSGFYRLTKNLDFSGTNLEVKAADFTGVLDGNGYTITNINITGYSNSNGAGLFRVLKGTVKNIGLLNVVLQKPADDEINYAYAGAIAGVINGATIDNVFISVDISQSKWYGGGVSGQAYGANKITNCVIIHNGSLKTEATKEDGLLIGRGNDTTSVDLTGTYVVSTVTNTSLLTSTNFAEFSTYMSGKTGVVCTKAELLEKDFTAYNKAVKDNVSALNAQ